MEIRRLTETDAEVYWNLRLEALEREPLAFGEAVEEHRRSTAAHAAARFRDTSNDSFVLGAFIGGELIGTAGFVRDRSIKRRHKGHVWGMYVKSDHRGSGIGRALLSALVEVARTVSGLEELTLSVTDGQSAAKSLYLSLGFEQWGREPNALRVGLESVGEDYLRLVLRW